MRIICGRTAMVPFSNLNFTFLSMCSFSVMMVREVLPVVALMKGFSANIKTKKWLLFKWNDILLAANCSELS